MQHDHLSVQKFSQSLSLVLPSLPELSKQLANKAKNNVLFFSCCFFFPHLIFLFISFRVFISFFSNRSHCAVQSSRAPAPASVGFRSMASNAGNNYFCVGSKSGGGWGGWGDVGAQTACGFSLFLISAERLLQISIHHRGEVMALYEPVCGRCLGVTVCLCVCRLEEGGARGGYACVLAISIQENPS